MALNGKVAVVYSGARGIGKAYCEALLQKGCKVYVGDILTSEGSDTVDELKSRYKDGEIAFSKCDVLIDAEVNDLLSKAVEAYGQVNIVVANAGIIDENNWSKCLELNLGGVIRVFYAAMKHMSKDKGGRGGKFVATASRLGFLPVPVVPTYVATKHGIVGFIRSWGTEANYNITHVKCNCICPALVDTKILNIKPTQYYCKQHYDDHMVSCNNLEKRMHPDEVAQALIAVLEDEKANGQCVVVDKEGYSYVNFPSLAL